MIKNPSPWIINTIREINDKEKHNRQHKNNLLLNAFFIIDIYRHSLQNNSIRTEYSQSSFQEMGKPQRYQAAVNECTAQDTFISRNAGRRECRRSS